MERLFRTISVVVMSCALAIIILPGCGDDDDDTVTGSTPQYGIIVGVVTLPDTADGEMLWAILDVNTDGDEYLSLASITCDNTMEYQYYFDNVPIGKYYVYAGIFFGHDEGPPRSDDYFSYYGTGLTPPGSTNVTVTASDTAYCNITLQIVP